MRILALDPGERTGWAIGEAGSILDCGLIHITADRPCSGFLPSFERGLVVIETPVYRQHNNKVDPNDLISLGLKVGRIQEVYLTLGNEVRLILPTDWKGGTPKDIQIKRTIKALGSDHGIVRLIGTFPKSYQHNAFDAVGILIDAMR